LCRERKGKREMNDESKVATVGELVCMAEGSIEDISGVLASWEYSRSGADPRHGIEQSASQYLHVRGGDGDRFTLRVSDHWNNHEHRWNVVEGMRRDRVETVLAEFRKVYSSLLPYDRDAHKRRLESEWRSEAHAALKEHSTEDLVASFRYHLEDRRINESLNCDWLTEEISKCGAKFSRLESEEKTISAWIEAITQSLAVTIECSEMLGFYNAMIFCAGFEDTRLLRSRADYGSDGADLELDRRKFLLEYIAEVLAVEAIPTGEFDVYEWMDGWIREGIESICDSPEEFPDVWPEPTDCLSGA
jgi:hypothetical protein